MNLNKIYWLKNLKNHPQQSVYENYIFQNYLRIIKNYITLIQDVLHIFRPLKPYATICM